MIHDVDESLRALVRRDVLNGSKVDISFEAPNKDWSARRQGPSLNLYLYDIREDLDRREVMFTDVRDENGRIVERRQPPRRFKLSYLVTAWTQRPEDEHRLLSSFLSSVVSSDTIPADLLEGELVEWPHMVRVTVGLPLSQDRSISDVWTALGGELKPSLDLVVTVPFPAKTLRTMETGPWVTEEPRIGLVAPDGTVEEAPSKPNGQSRAMAATRPRVGPGDRGVAVREMQRALFALGVELPVSGVFDEATEAAVKAFQEEHGLEPDGIVSAAVWAAVLDLQQDEEPAAPIVETFVGTKPGSPRSGREFTIRTMPRTE